ncbi:conserved Plasmodium membrane protein, unknown function [Plasmodium ovale wallikeri]|uniref:Uncharacterized protein n=1 Tax=Plasmodium ovale wallikeri TaxID=864142 RepID=A0A1A8YKU1_PLAOA|nr:conserved Plasmodium membrane protein, unknown function [Plasmodium ovale wallikeri]
MRIEAVYATFCSAVPHYGTFSSFAFSFAFHRHSLLHWHILCLRTFARTYARTYELAYEIAYELAYERAYERTYELAYERACERIFTTPLL